jgi:broad specificity phosphatase PhoE
MVQNLVLLRHGEAEINASRAKAGKMKPQPLAFSKIKNPKSPLTALGRKQAEKTGAALKKRFGSFDIAFVSPYLRAKQTAGIISKRVCCNKIIIDGRIRERSKGKLEQLTHRGVREKFPKEAERRLRQGSYHYRPPDGENFPDVKARIREFMNEAITIDDKNILIITHGVGIASIMDFFEHFPIKKLMRINDHVRLCSVTCYSCEKNGLRRRFYDKIYY